MLNRKELEFIKKHYGIRSLSIIRTFRSIYPDYTLNQAISEIVRRIKRKEG